MKFSIIKPSFSRFPIQIDPLPQKLPFHYISTQSLEQTSSKKFRSALNYRSISFHLQTYIDVHTSSFLVQVSLARFLALKFPRQTCPTLIPICSVAGKRWFVVSGTFRDGPACVRIVYPLKQGQMHPWIRLSVSFVPSYRPPNTQSPLTFSLRHITEAKMRRLGFVLLLDNENFRNEVGVQWYIV